MTGLAQRARFLVEANELLHQRRNQGGLASCLLCLDLDRLKTINALLGFDAGDAVIRRASSHLAEALGAQAPLARLACAKQASGASADDDGIVRSATTAPGLSPFCESTRARL
mgnify:CR=1 FL=1